MAKCLKLGEDQLHAITLLSLLTFMAWGCQTEQSNWLGAGLLHKSYTFCQCSDIIGVRVSYYKQEHACFPATPILWNDY